MNNLAYSKQKSEEVAPRVEEILRKDLGASSPLAYSIAESGNQDGALTSILKEAAKFFTGGAEAILFCQKFEISSPRAITIQVNMNRQGIGCYAGTIVFSAFINKTVAGEVMLEEPKIFGTSKFTGNTDAAAKLNTNKDLLKAAGKFAKVKSDVSGGLEMKRFFRILPTTGGSVVMVNTLARATSMGMGATTDANDFFGILSMIEAAL